VISITNTTTNWAATAAADTIAMVVVWYLEGRHRKTILYVVVYHFAIMIPESKGNKVEKI